ncbi:plasma membrane ATPase 4 [Phtheirospermum japonicum]|uniref:Plasma membrane ATPase 4 n=1 Tax=Phtheirospermum japonicum TaxID=374723 RepID=A0A830BH72_9LAMI|nr:plasma membrane ATPase 4 [Phtheirospermum japonicum]
MYLLEVANIVGAINKMCGLAEEGVDPSGNYNSLKFTLLASGTTTKMRFHVGPSTSVFEKPT